MLGQLVGIILFIFASVLFICFLDNIGKRECLIFLLLSIISFNILFKMCIIPCMYSNNYKVIRTDIVANLDDQTRLVGSRYYIREKDVVSYYRKTNGGYSRRVISGNITIYESDSTPRVEVLSRQPKDNIFSRWTYDNIDCGIYKYKIYVPKKTVSSDYKIDN